VRRVPIDRRRQSIGEIYRRCLTQLALDLRGFDRIPPVRAVAILDKADQVAAATAPRGRRASMRSQIRATVAPLLCTSRADRIGLADPSALEHRLHRRDMIVDMQPVADIGAVAIDQRRLAAGSSAGSAFGCLERSVMVVQLVTITDGP